jgi:hypothetical protein
MHSFNNTLRQRGGVNGAEAAAFLLYIQHVFSEMPLSDHFVRFLHSTIRVLSTRKAAGKQVKSVCVY